MITYYLRDGGERPGRDHDRRRVGQGRSERSRARRREASTASCGICATPAGGFGERARRPAARWWWRRWTRRSAGGGAGRIPRRRGRRRRTRQCAGRPARDAGHATRVRVTVPGVAAPLAGNVVVDARSAAEVQRRRPRRASGDPHENLRMDARRSAPRARAARALVAQRDSIKADFGRRRATRARRFAQRADRARGRPTSTAPSTR